MHALSEVRADSAEICESRLLAPSAVHDILTREKWSKAQLTELVDATIAPLRREHFDLRGGSTTVCLQTASTLAMTPLELGANAAKYGALSTAPGRVEIKWAVHAAGHLRRLHLIWRERGGPPVAPLARKGFGLRLIERSLAAEAGASVTLNFEREGVVRDIRLPLGAEILQ